MIEGYMGLPGMGKTYAMTRKAIKFLRQGRDVYANFWVKPDARDKGRIIQFNQLYEVLDAENCVILLDEAGLVAPAAMWKDIPWEVLAAWREHRHFGVELYYTAQDPQDVAAALRRVTQFRVQCDKYGPLCIQRHTNMKGNQKYGTRWHLFDKAVAARYKTREKGVARQSYIKSTYGQTDETKGRAVDAKV